MHKNTNPLWVSNTKAKIGIQGIFSGASLHECAGSVGIATQPMLPSNLAAKAQYAGLHVKKTLCVIQKRYWFFDNAAPIPGVCFVTKRKML